MTLPITTRLYIALALFVATAGAAIAIKLTGADAGEWDSVLLGYAGATFLQLADMLQAKKKATEPPPQPDRQLGREETNPRLPLAIPRDDEIPTLPPDYPEGD